MASQCVPTPCPPSSRRHRLPLTPCTRLPPQAVENIAAILNGKTPAGHVNYDCIPGVVYTYPEIASCGKTEEQLKEANVEYNTGSFPFQANSRARANDDADGFVKILAEKDTDRIVGIHIIGPNAGEMIAEGVLGMECVILF